MIKTYLNLNAELFQGVSWVYKVYKVVYKIGGANQRSVLKDSWILFCVSVSQLITHLLI